MSTIIVITIIFRIITFQIITAHRYGFHVVLSPIAPLYLHPNSATCRPIDIDQNNNSVKICIMLLWQNSTHKQYAFNTTIHLTNSTINHASQRLHSHDDRRRTTVIYAVTYASTVMIDNAMDMTINDNWCIAYARCPYHIIRRDGWQRYSLIHVHHEK